MGIEIDIKGNPVAQKRHRHTRTGHVYDPSSKDKTLWKSLLGRYAMSKPLKDELVVLLRFTVARPKSHYRTGKNKHLIKDSAPKKHIQRPDIDNFVKFYLDVLQDMGMYENDSQITTIIAEKKWGKHGRVEICIDEEATFDEQAAFGGWSDEIYTA